MKLSRRQFLKGSILSALAIMLPALPAVKRSSHRSDFDLPEPGTMSSAVMEVKFSHDGGYTWVN